MKASRGRGGVRIWLPKGPCTHMIYTLAQPTYIGTTSRPKYKKRLVGHMGPKGLNSQDLRKRLYEMHLLPMLHVRVSGLGFRSIEIFEASRCVRLQQNLLSGALALAFTLNQPKNTGPQL